MGEKIQFNAHEGLKRFDAVRNGTKDRLIDLQLSEPISDEEWDDYNKAKDECENRGVDWKSERNARHDRIARIYYEACKEYERRYEQ